MMWPMLSSGLSEVGGLRLVTTRLMNVTMARARPLSDARDPVDEY
jgi:hypothetical protein